MTSGIHPAEPHPHAHRRFEMLTARSHNPTRVVAQAGHRDDRFVPQNLLVKGFCAGSTHRVLNLLVPICYV